jgi:hypothetical protein
MLEDRREYWAKAIAEQEASGLGVRAFCGERGVCTASFYQWRRRLRREPPAVRFALIETKPAPGGAAPLELVFISGERLRIFGDADLATLHLALAAIRA